MNPDIPAMLPFQEKARALVALSYLFLWLISIALSKSLLFPCTCYYNKIAQGISALHVCVVPVPLKAFCELSF